MLASHSTYLMSVTQVCKWFGLNPEEINAPRIPFCDSCDVLPSDQAGLGEGGFLMPTETAFQLHQRAKSHTCHSEKQPEKCGISSFSSVFTTPSCKWHLHAGIVFGDSWSEGVPQYEIQIYCVLIVKTTSNIRLVQVSASLGYAYVDIFMKHFGGIFL